MRGLAQSDTEMCMRLYYFKQTHKQTNMKGR